MDIDSQQTMEETILVGDDLMVGPPSPVIPQEIASHVLEGVDLCDGILRNLFLCKSCVFYLTILCKRWTMCSIDWLILYVDFLGGMIDYFLNCAKR